MFLKFWLETNRISSHVETLVEVDDDEWAEMSEAEQGDYAKTIFWETVLARLGDWDWEVSRTGTSVKEYE